MQFVTPYLASWSTTPSNQASSLKGAHIASISAKLHLAHDCSYLSMSSDVFISHPVSPIRKGQLSVQVRSVVHPIDD